MPLMRLVVLLAAFAAASSAKAAGPDPWDCAPWIAAAERVYGIPDRLLQAIAEIETGQVAASGRNPAWALNVGGETVAAETLDQAVRVVLTEARRVPVDVGCVQINLQAHAPAVPDFAWLFLPRYNAAYGAWHLTGLFRRLGSWGQAVAVYHAGHPGTARGSAYCRRVARAFAGLRSDPPALDCR